MGEGAFNPRLVLAALATYPPIDAGGARVAAVGGFVRDVWLDRVPRELDLVLEGDAAKRAPATQALQSDDPKQVAKAKKEIGTATRNTVCTELVMAAITCV